MADELIPPAPAAPAEPPAPPEPPSPEPEPAAPDPVESLTDDPALDAELSQSAIQIPTGERLVPESALGRMAQSYRAKLKEARQGSAAEADLRARLAEAEARLQRSEGYAQAFLALQQGQQNNPPAPQGLTAEQTRELEDIARDYDFYDGEGKLDLAKAERHQQRVRREAQAVAQQQTAPLIRHTLGGQAQHNVARAKATVHPVTKQKADPAIIDRLVSHLASQPGGLETLANPETVKQVWLNAYALSTFAPQAPAAPVAPEPPAPPVVSESSGGAPKTKVVGLSPSEKMAARSAGLSEKQYLEIASSMKW